MNKSNFLRSDSLCDQRCLCCLIKIETAVILRRPLVAEDQLGQPVLCRLLVNLRHFFSAQVQLGAGIVRYLRIDGSGVDISRLSENIKNMICYAPQFSPLHFLCLWKILHWSLPGYCNFLFIVTQPCNPHGEIEACGWSGWFHTPHSYHTLMCLSWLSQASASVSGSYLWVLCLIGTVGHQ